jgi:hypothetical protein
LCEFTHRVFRIEQSVGVLTLLRLRPLVGSMEISLGITINGT